jgi:hypothetical protein
VNQSKWLASFLTATSHFDALCLLKALRLSKDTSPGRLGGIWATEINRG